MAGWSLTVLTFIVTADFVDHLRAGYWFLLIAFVAEGFLIQAIPPHAWSVLCVFDLGLLSFGFAVGPLVPRCYPPHGNDSVHFFLATASQ
ncbi:hypothetical protein EDC04DRAFT_1293798 [Pisolithus marmoratus]|nr:hypothetical protein EDC04DRAFT_1293798 [Pisolithus marmoratus]